jgi:hypothetical protein
MTPRQLWAVLTLVGALALIVVLLVTAGEDTAASLEDARGDVDVEKGPGAPRDVAAADIVVAEVRGDDSEVVFELRLAAPVEGRRPAGALAVQWDVIEDGDYTWLVTADLGSRPYAGLVSQRTTYGSSTLDGTLPGDFAVAEDVVTVTIRTAGLRAWPDEFDWTVGTTLDPNRSDTGSPVAEDRAPEADVGHFAP